MQMAGLASCNFGGDINTKYRLDKMPAGPMTPTVVAVPEPCRVKAALGNQSARRGHAGHRWAFRRQRDL